MPATPPIPTRSQTERYATAHHWYAVSCLVPLGRLDEAFTAPATGTYSTLKPFTIVNPSQFNNDLAVTRTFKLAGVQNVQARWEVFNVINRVNDNAPVTSLNSGTFGQILTAGDPRIMQFALRFTF